MINVALCGYGTIGHGVKALLEKEPLVYLSKVLDLPTKKAELGDLLVTDYRTIVEDPSINVVIECMGGDALPYPIITASLKAQGKPSSLRTKKRFRNIIRNTPH
jgi:homoserine dehydrogenase